MAIAVAASLILAHDLGYFGAGLSAVPPRQLWPPLTHRTVKIVECVVEVIRISIMNLLDFVLEQEISNQVSVAQIAVVVVFGFFFVMFFIIVILVVSLSSPLRLATR